MSTGKAAEALGLPRSTLKYWIKKHGLEPADRTISGYPRWDLEDLRRQINRVRDEIQARRERESD